MRLVAARTGMLEGMLTAVGMQSSQVVKIKCRRRQLTSYYLTCHCNSLRIIHNCRILCSTQSPLPSYECSY